MTPEEFQAKLGKQGIELSAKQMDQFASYFHLLIEWNKKMNLTAITEREEVYLKHFMIPLHWLFLKRSQRKESYVTLVQVLGFLVYH